MIENKSDHNIDSNDNTDNEDFSNDDDDDGNI